MIARAVATIQSNPSRDHRHTWVVGRSLWHWLFRGLAIALTLWTLILFVLAVPVRLGELRSVATLSSAVHLQLTPADALALGEFGINTSIYAGLVVAIECGLMLAFMLITVLMLSRKSAEPLGFFFAVTATTYGAYVTAPLDSLLAVSSALNWQSRGLQALGLWCAIVFFYLFPDGRFTLRWTRTVAVACALWCISWVIHPIALLDPVNPFDLTLPGLIFHLSWFVTGVVAQVQRFRQTTNPVQRQQTKWVSWSMAGAVVLYAFFFAPPLLWSSFQRPGWPALIDHLVIQPGYLLLLYTVPLTLLFAILRYRLWDVDLLLNRALVYSILTALLALVYLGSVVSLPAFFPALTGLSSPVTISLATLITTALVAPLRRRVQGYIDYRFFRRQYDAARTLAAFGATVRDEIDMERLMSGLKAAVEETLTPVAVSCWVQHGAAYQHCLHSESDSMTSIADNDPFVQQLRQASGVLDLAGLTMDSPGLNHLRRQGFELVAPMLSHGELSGWLSLGPRCSGAGYSSADRRLLTTLATQAAPALRVAHLVQEQEIATVARERMAHELRLARTVQQTLLPKALPKLDGWAMATHFQPAREVGGDFYDFLPLANGCLGLVFGDVIGKGMPAALLMASTRSLVRSVARQQMAPGAILAEVNDLLHEDVPPGMFVTCFVAVLDPRTGRLRFANAGHTLPLLRTGGKVHEMRAIGMPLGVFAGQEYEEVEAQLAPADRLLFYSDGISEAHSPARVMYGTARMVRVLEEQNGAGATVIGVLLDDLRRFEGDEHEQEDDVTLLMVERTDKPRVPEAAS